MIDRWFWLVVTIACIVWYSTVTIYVAVKGMRNIKDMLKRLEMKRQSPGN